MYGQHVGTDDAAQWPGRPDIPAVAAWKALLHLSQSGHKIHAQWVPLHCGIDGNELADRVTGEAALESQLTTASPGRSPDNNQGGGKRGPCEYHQRVAHRLFSRLMGGASPTGGGHGPVARGRYTPTARRSPVRLHRIQYTIIHASDRARAFPTAAQGAMQRDLCKAWPPLRNFH